MTNILYNPPEFDGSLNNLFAEAFQGEVDELEEEGYNITFETDEGLLDPVYVKKYGGDSYGKHTVLHDDCGNTHTRNGGATGYQVTVDGILTLEQLRKTREIGLDQGAEVTVALEPWVETYICDEFTWDKPNDLNEWYSPEYPDGAEAYTFHFKSRDPTQQSN